MNKILLLFRPRVGAFPTKGKAPNDMSCSRCRAHAEPAFSIPHRCGHSTHTDCFPLGEEPNFKQCFNCDPANVNRGGGGGASGALPRGRAPEPHTTDAVEYWRNPGARNVDGSRSIISTIISPLRRTAEPAPPTPFQLLKRKTPIAQIMSKHGYGLDHMLRDGLDIDDFLVNGYTWDDLCQFEYIADMGPVRCLETLHRGLGLTANHLRDNPDRLPVAAFLAATQMRTSDWGKRLGLQFPENGPLHCFGDTNWDAMDCVAMGLTMDNLMDLGLYRIEQYQDLMKGLTRGERAAAERNLGTTPEHLASLEVPPPQGEDLEVEEVAEPPPREEKEEQERSDVEEEEEEEKQLSEDEEPSPPPPQRRPKPAAVAAAAKPQLSVTEARRRERMKIDGFVSKKK
jgi:hypothetical protein